MDPSQGKDLTKPFWDFYKQCITQVLGRDPFERNRVNTDQYRRSLKRPVATQSPKDDQQDAIQEEYARFIAQTRKHQAERDREKAKRKKEEDEEQKRVFYQDVSRATFDKSIEVPDKNDPIDKPSASERRQKELIELYGSIEGYEKIRSLEMVIDEHFNEMKVKLNPSYWPAMPINVKPYFDNQ